MLWFKKHSKKKEIPLQQTSARNNPKKESETMEELFEKLWSEGTINLTFTEPWGAFLNQTYESFREIHVKFGAEGMERFFDFAVNKKKKELLEKDGKLIEPIVEEHGDAGTKCEQMPNELKFLRESQKGKSMIPSDPTVGMDEKVEVALK